MKARLEALRRPRGRAGPTLLAAGALALALALPAGPSRGASLPLPQWPELFNEDGSLRDAYDAAGVLGANGVPDYLELWGGVSARFLDDVLSDGKAVDYSSFNGAADLGEALVDNGLVARGDDLGNALFVGLENPLGELEIFVGIEGLSHDAASVIEIELNQDAVSTGMGRPWPMTGERRDDDLRLRVEFDQGTLLSAEVAYWESASGDFVQLHTAAGDGTGCAGLDDTFLACQGVPLMATHNDLGRWTPDAKSLPPLAADSFLEAGVNVERVLGYRPRFRAIQIRSAADISLSGL